jgi:osmoprotectant transport system substrate-binding protein
MATLTGCASDPDAPDAPAPLPSVVVGSGTSVASELVARFYAGALARMGVSVTTVLDIGDRPAYLAALEANRVTLVPEFTGGLLRYYDAAAAAQEPTDVGKALSKSLPEGLSVSDFSDTTDWRSAVVVTRPLADQLGARSVKDLAPHCHELILGVTADSPLVTPLRTTYGCTFAAVHQYAAADLPVALARGEVQAAMLPPPEDLGLVALTDDKYAIAARNPLPLYRTGTLTQAQLKRLNLVAGELTTAALAAMVTEATTHHRSLDDLAHAWLDSHSF